MTARQVYTLSAGRKLLLSAIGAAFLAGPFAVGFVHVVNLRAQLLHPASEPLPSFEVATIRPSHSDLQKLGFRMTRIEFNVQNASLTDLIKFAYSVKSNAQLPKGPRWIDSDKFDINARIEESQAETIQKLPPDQRFDQRRLMLQSLLSDRFGLKLSSQTKDLPVYALIVAKGGPKLKEVEGLPLPQPGHSSPPPPPGTLAPGVHLPTLTGRRGQLTAGAVSMPFFVNWVSGQPEMGDRVVTDATGLKGSYDFELNWSPDDGHTPLLNGVPQETTGPSIFTAFQEQLGLKLESRKAPVEVLIIDHAERPSEN